MPITDVKDDKIGFGKMAKHIAASFLENDLSHGFVIGVEGAWGSGKSSLIKLALKELAKDQQRIRPDGNVEISKQKPVVVEFSPWLVGSREELLHQFFLDLSSAIPQLSTSSKRKTRKLMKAYSEVTSGAALVAELTADVTQSLPARLLGWFLKKSGRWASKRARLSLNKAKSQLFENLKELKHPIIVFIDDLDRLEPREVAEILRLVRAVADFPYVGYILAYDPEILAKSLEQSISINDGHAFLEKIVQASFRVPNAQSFDLRNWLSDEFDALREKKNLDLDEERRVSSVLHVWGDRYLVTPRDVVRTVSSLRLNFVPIREQVDPGDALFLQLVRLKNDDLFRWIQRYVGYLSTRTEDRFYIQDEDRTQLNAAHSIVIGRKKRTPIGLELLDASGIRESEARQEFVEQLSAHLPGLNYFSGNAKDDYNPPCEFRDRNEVQKYTLGRRLASPQHYSLYFSFSYTAGHLSDEEITSFLDLVVANKDVATAKIVKWANKSRPQGGKMGEIVLDRVVELRPLITPEQVSGLFEVLGQTMDELARNANPPSGYPDFLSGTRHRVFGLIEIIPKERRMQILHHLFRTAISLAWLSGIIQSNTQANESGWASVDETAILTEDEFSVLSHEFADRLAAEEPKKLLETPYFIFLLYAWILVGDKASCQNWIKHVASTDLGFLNVIEKMTYKSNSSYSGVSHRIRSNDLIHFFGSFEAPIKRLRAITRDAEDDTLRQRANNILGIIDKASMK